MRMCDRLSAVSIIVLIAAAITGPVSAQPATDVPVPAAPPPLWNDATADTIGATGEWTNKVEVADVDGDGRLDIVFANGGDYDTPGAEVAPRLFLNAGPGAPFVDGTTQAFGDATYHARVIKPRDVTGDGIVDLLVGTAYGSQTRLLQGLGGGRFEDVTGSLLPALDLSVGDLEVGDVDADGDLDIVLADWGAGSPMRNTGGPVRLWRNGGDGQGWSADDAAVPGELIGFSWDLELVDVDGDWDLDLAVSCKMCPTSRLYLNDGTGTFSDVTATHMPAASNNYEFEAMDLDGDGAPELVTINDGPGAAERVLRNDGSGQFSDATAEWWPRTQNPGHDDNVIAFLDADQDGDADFLVGSLDGPDRLMLNDGSGHLTRQAPVFSGLATPGTLSIALGDLDGDDRLDVAEAQGEVVDPDHVYLATDALAPDTAAPTIDAVAAVPVDGGVEIRARVHDRKTPVLPDDFSSVSVRAADDPAAVPVPLTLYGDALWRATLSGEADGELVVCATDRAGNEACSEPTAAA